MPQLDILNVYHHKIRQSAGLQVYDHQPVRGTGHLYHHKSFNQIEGLPSQTCQDYLKVYHHKELKEVTATVFED